MLFSLKQEENSDICYNLNKYDDIMLRKKIIHKIKNGIRLCSFERPGKFKFIEIEIVATRCGSGRVLMSHYLISTLLKVGVMKISGDE
jgi:hypothetical protein